MSKHVLCHEFFEAVIQEYNQKNQRLREIDHRLKQLEHLGYTTASVHWRRGHKGKRNMYLIHSTRSAWVQAGNSRFEYIGAKPEKQQAAYDRKARYLELRELQAEASTIRHDLVAVEYHLGSVGQMLFGRQPEYAAVAVAIP